MIICTVSATASAELYTLDRNYNTPFQSQSIIECWPFSYSSHAIYLLPLSSSQLVKMLGAAGRAAGGLVKQAVKAGNVSQILPTASVARKYPFYTNFTRCQV